MEHPLQQGIRNFRKVVFFWDTLYTSTIVEKSQTNAINVTMLLLMLIRGYTMEKSQTNAVNATLQPHRQAFEDSFENTP